MNRSLVGKIWLAMVILVTVVMFILGCTLSQFFKDFYFSLKSEELAKNGNKIADMIAGSPGRMEWEAELMMISRYIDAKIVVTDKAGLIRAGTINGRGMGRGQKLNYPDVDKILKGEIVAERGTYPGLDTTVLSVGVPIKYGSEVVGAVFLYSPVESVNATVWTVQKFVLYGAVGTILLATILSFVLSKRITKPIHDMNRVAMEMANGNFEEKVNTVSEDEIGLLGNTLNFLSSELQKNIDALSTQKDQLENILSSMTDAVITFDTNGSVLIMNPPACEIFNLKPYETLQNNSDDIIVPEIKELFLTALRDKTEIKDEVVISDHAYKIGLIPLHFKDGQIGGVLVVLHDITKEKRLELLRREFVANVSHELRSPLSLLQGYVEALADGLAENEEERTKYLDILLDETLRLRRLVNDLLDLTQLETGNQIMKFDAISVSELVLRVTNVFKPLFAEQNKTLNVSLPEGLPAILGDEDRLQQVLVNLLDNAMKYTSDQGTVDVGAVSGPTGVDIFVEDSGPGIPAEELGHIWERFYKVDKARKREAKGGTGLGLAIAKNIVLAHGGEVSVTSELGRGTKFTFSIKKFT